VAQFRRDEALRHADESFRPQHRKNFRAVPEQFRFCCAPFSEFIIRSSGARQKSFNAWPFRAAPEEF